MLSAQFSGTVPTELASIDFAVDVVVLATSNPQIEFAADDGAEIVVGMEQLCQGIAPRCVGYVIHGASRDSVMPVSCPYTGPDPCDVP